MKLAAAICVGALPTSLLGAHHRLEPRTLKQLMATVLAIVAVQTGLNAW